MPVDGVELVEGRCRERVSNQGKSRMKNRMGSQVRSQARSVPVTRRTRLESEASYMDSGVEELVEMLRSTNDMEVHGDILHYMVITYGISLKTSVGVVKDLLRFDLCCFV